MPIAAASVKVTEQRCPVTRSPSACASSIAARSSAREMRPWNFTHVAPSLAQYDMTRRASSRVVILRFIDPREVSPSRYGPVIRKRGPGVAPASTLCFRCSSW